MHQCGELLGLRLAGKQRDLSAVADALGGRDAFVVLKLDALLSNELDKPVAMAANFAGNGVGVSVAGTDKVLTASATLGLGLRQTRSSVFVTTA